jgi:hypothetical protein
MTIDWQMEADRANRLYAASERRVIQLEAALREIGTLWGAGTYAKQIARAALDQSSPPKERDIDAERLDASGSYWPDGRRPPDAIGS